VRICAAEINLINRRYRNKLGVGRWRFRMLPLKYRYMSALIQILANTFVVIFLAGVVGSMVVVLISFVEDLELLVESDDEAAVDRAVPRAYS